MKKYSFLFVLLTACISLNAQVGINTDTPDSTAALDIQSPGGSDNRGILLPRMTTTQRVGINNPATSLMVFDTDRKLFYYFDGSFWIPLVPAERPAGDYASGAAPVLTGHIVIDTGSVTAPQMNAEQLTTDQITVPGFGTNALVPPGVIVMWSGAIIDIPTGWALCDGSGTTPDLRGRFIVGYDAAVPAYNTPENTGGNTTLVLDKSNLPQHRHTVSSGTVDGGAISLSGGDHNHPSRGSDIVDTDNGDISVPTFGGGGAYTVTDGGGAHGHSVSGTTGNGASDGLLAAPIDIRPPYFVLAYIIKL